VISGLRKREASYGRWLIEQGALLFTATTILNYLVGFWFLVRLPGDLKMIFLGRSPLATALLGLGMLLPLAAIMHLILAKAAPSPARPAYIGIGSGVLTLAVMVVLRDVVRNAYLAPHFQVEQLRVAPQWGIIVLFVALFVAGLGTLFYMLRAVSKAAQPGTAATAVSAK